MTNLENAFFNLLSSCYPIDKNPIKKVSCFPLGDVEFYSCRADFNYRHSLFKKVNLYEEIGKLYLRLKDPAFEYYPDLRISQVRGWPPSLIFRIKPEELEILCEERGIVS